MVNQACGLDELQTFHLCISATKIAIGSTNHERAFTL